MIIVADESVDYGVVISLRNKGFDVLSISESHSGIEDVEVLSIAVQNQSILITEDKDFGELTYRLKKVHKGILLVRLVDIPRAERIEVVVETISDHLKDLQNNFSVLDKRGLRIKTSHTSL